MYTAGWIQENKARRLLSAAGAEKKPILGETSFPSMFILDFQVLELWGNQLLLLNPPIFWYFVIAALAT